MIKRSKVRNQFFKNNPDLQNTIPELPSVFSRTHCFQQEHETVMDYEPIFTSINMFIIKAGLVSLKTGSTQDCMLEKLFLHNAFHIKYHPLLYHAYFLYIHSLVQDLNTFNGQWTTTSWRQDQTTEISIIFGRAQMEERGRVGQSLFWAGNLDNAVKFNGNWELSTTGLKERRNTMQCNGNGRPSSTSLDNRLNRTSQCNAMGTGFKPEKGVATQSRATCSWLDNAYGAPVF